MIADGYTQGALGVIETTTISNVRLHYRTWDRVLHETQRLHEGWLTVATKRAREDLTTAEPPPS